jgi:hypothetical protein
MPLIRFEKVSNPIRTSQTKECGQTGGNIREGFPPSAECKLHSMRHTRKMRPGQFAGVASPFRIPQFELLRNRIRVTTWVPIRAALGIWTMCSQIARKKFPLANRVNYNIPHSFFWNRFHCPQIQRL